MARLTSTTTEPRTSLQREAAGPRIAILGSGTMGRAIASGLVRNRVVTPNDLAITSRTAAQAERLATELGARHVHDNVDACRAADIVIVCVKPKDLIPLLTDLAGKAALEHRPLLISIAAGITIAAIEAAVSSELPVVRAMPNTPCRIAQGMTVIAGGTHTTVDHLRASREIFTSVGHCIELEERHLDAVTAVSASGPAFIYLIIEALADGGIMCGLTRQTATELVAHMAQGAAAMVLATGRHPAELKDDVTTPGGCTIAGLLALEDRQVRSALAHAVQITARTAAGLGQ